MKLQIDSENMTIKIEGNHKISDILKQLKTLLPKESKLGYYEDYTLECNTTIVSWNNPIYVPYLQIYNYQPACGTITIECSTATSNPLDTVLTTASTTNFIANVYCIKTTN